MNNRGHPPPPPPFSNVPGPWSTYVPGTNAGFSPAPRFPYSVAGLRSSHGYSPGGVYRGPASYEGHATSPPRVFRTPANDYHSPERYNRLPNTSSSPLRRRLTDDDILCDNDSVVVNAGFSFRMGKENSMVHKHVDIQPAHSVPESTSSGLTRQIDKFLQKSDHTLDRYHSVIQSRSGGKVSGQRGKSMTPGGGGREDSPEPSTLGLSYRSQRSTSAASIAVKAEKHLESLNRMKNGGGGSKKAAPIAEHEEDRLDDLSSSDSSLDGFDTDDDVPRSADVFDISDDTSADLSKLSAIEVDPTTNCSTPFDPSRLDDLSSDSDDEYFDVVPLPGLRPQPPPAGLSTSPIPEQQPKPQQQNVLQEPPRLPPTHSQSLPSVNKSIAPNRMGNAQAQPSNASTASKGAAVPASENVAPYSPKNTADLANAINTLAPPISSKEDKKLNVHDIQKENSVHRSDAKSEKEIPPKAMMAANVEKNSDEKEVQPKAMMTANIEKKSDEKEIQPKATMTANNEKKPDQKSEKAETVQIASTNTKVSKENNQISSTLEEKSSQGKNKDIGNSQPKMESAAITDTSSQVKSQNVAEKPCEEALKPPEENAPVLKKTLDKQKATEIKNSQTSVPAPQVKNNSKVDNAHNSKMDSKLAAPVVSKEKIKPEGENALVVSKAASPTESPKSKVTTQVKNVTDSKNASVLGSKLENQEKLAKDNKYEITADVNLKVENTQDVRNVSNVNETNHLAISADPGITLEKLASSNKTDSVIFKKESENHKQPVVTDKLLKSGDKSSTKNDFKLGSAAVSPMSTHNDSLVKSTDNSVAENKSKLTVLEPSAKVKTNSSQEIISGPKKTDRVQSAVKSEDVNTRPEKIGTLKSDAAVEKVGDDKSDTKVEKVGDDKFDTKVEKVGDDKSDIKVEKVGDDKSDTKFEKVGDDKSDTKVEKVGDDKSDIPTKTGEPSSIEISSSTKDSPSSVPEKISLVEDKALINNGTSISDAAASKGLSANKQTIETSNPTEIEEKTHDKTTQDATKKDSQPNVVSHKTRAGSPFPDKSAVVGIKISAPVVTGKLQISPSSGPGPPKSDKELSVVKTEGNSCNVQNTVTNTASKVTEKNSGLASKNEKDPSDSKENIVNGDKSVPIKEMTKVHNSNEDKKIPVVNGVLNDADVSKTSKVDAIEKLHTDKSVPVTQVDKNAEAVKAAVDNISKEEDDFNDDISEIETYIDMSSRRSSVASVTSRTVSPDISFRTGGKRVKSDKLAAMMNLWEIDDISQVSERSKPKAPTGTPKVGKISGLKNMFEAGKAGDKVDPLNNPNLVKLKSQSGSAISETKAAPLKKSVTGSMGIASMNAAKFGGTSKFKKPSEVSPSQGEKILKREKSTLSNKDTKASVEKQENESAKQDQNKIVNDKKSDKDNANIVAAKDKSGNEKPGKEVDKMQQEKVKSNGDSDVVQDETNKDKQSSKPVNASEGKSDIDKFGKVVESKQQEKVKSVEDKDVVQDKTNKDKQSSKPVVASKGKSDIEKSGKDIESKQQEKVKSTEENNVVQDKTNKDKQSSKPVIPSEGKSDTEKPGKVVKSKQQEKVKAVGDNDVVQDKTSKDKQTSKPVVALKSETKNEIVTNGTVLATENSLSGGSEGKEIKKKKKKKKENTEEVSAESPKNTTSENVTDLKEKVSVEENKMKLDSNLKTEVSNIVNKESNSSNETANNECKDNLPITSGENVVASQASNDISLPVKIKEIPTVTEISEIKSDDGKKQNQTDKNLKLSPDSKGEIGKTEIDRTNSSKLQDEKVDATNNENKAKSSKKLGGIKSFIESVAKGGKTLEDKLSKTGLHVGKKSAKLETQKNSPTFESKIKKNLGQSSTADASLPDKAAAAAKNSEIKESSTILKSAEDLGETKAERKQTLAKAIPALESEVEALIKEAAVLIKPSETAQPTSYMASKLTLPTKEVLSVASFPDSPMGGELSVTSLPASPTHHKDFLPGELKKVVTSLPASPTKEVQFHFDESQKTSTSDECEDEVFVDAIDPAQLDTLMPLPDVQSERDIRSRSRTPMDIRERSVTPSPIVAQAEAILSETDRLLRRSRSNKSLRRSYSRSLSNAALNKLSEVTADLSEEHTTAHLAGERLEAEQAERMKLEKEIDRLQTDVKRMTTENGKLEMEKLALRSEVLSAAELNGDLDDEEAADASLYKRKYEWCLREMELLKKQLKQQQEDDLDQLLLLKKQLEKKVADAYEETDEQRQIVAQLKRKCQRLQAEMNDLKILLEEQTSRNNLLEKKQRKFDQEVMSVQEELRHERANKDKIQRERDQILSEKYSFEQEVTTLKLELELKEEKVCALNRELDDLTSSGKVEEEVATLKKAKHDLELRIKDQEEELDDLAGQVQMLEGAKVRLEMSMEQTRKEHRREVSQREEELEEVRISAQKKIKSLEAQLENEHEERTLLVREKHELERRITDLQDRTITHVDEDYVHKLKKELKKTKALLRDTQTMLEKAQSEGSHKLLLRQLKTQLEDAEFAKTAAIKARQCAEADLSEMSGQLDEVLRNKKESEDKCARITKEKAEIQTQLEESEEEVAEVMKKYKAVVSQLSVDQITLSEQSQQIAELEHSKQVLQERMLELSSKVEVLEGETANIHTQRRLEMKIKEMESKLELELTTRQRLESQIGRLKDQIERLTGECDAARMKEAQALDQSKRVGRQLRDAKEDLSNLQQRHTEASNKKSELEKQLELADSEVVTLKSDLKLAFKRIEDLQQAIQGDLSDSDSDLSDRMELPNSPCSEAMSAISEDVDDTSTKESFA